LTGKAPPGARKPLFGASREVTVGKDTEPSAKSSKYQCRQNQWPTTNTSSAELFSLHPPYYDKLLLTAPTLDEIDCSEDVLHSRKIVGIGLYAVKVGRQVDFTEEDMLFVAHIPSVCVRHVYAQTSKLKLSRMTMPNPSYLLQYVIL